MSISAGELKKKGVSIIQTKLDKMNEETITVKGKDAFVVMNMEHYNYLRECELEIALQQAKKEYEQGHFVKESVETHLQRIANEL
ncbi:prevent-host-death family protein [Cyanobacterium stanieri PCC 7202]|uniref:Prevent-host-death family protein n=1 Tax=Cyanobacterium stanieri (strain ATCC 29140 / PCC 7202) TaxID=292563 RepID=K9YGK4_CYASC|nr:prevent-host-death family protein [Cyanobacterium stanieri PCC 7202]